MRQSSAVVAAVLAFAFLNPNPAFCKGKKPQPADENVNFQAQEEMISNQEAVPPPSHVEVQPEVEPKPEAEIPQKPLPPQAVAQEPAAPAPAGAETHVVWIWQETRDCLWNLAKKHYKDPWQWKRIYIENRNAILNPNIIFPKQKIIIPPLQPAVQ